MEVVVKADNGKVFAQLMASAIERAMEEIGMVAEGHVVGFMTKEKIVDTGRLRNSITHASKDDSVIVGTNVEYARYVHNGTSRMHGRPYLTTPITQHQKEYAEILKNNLENS